VSRIVVLGLPTGLSGAKSSDSSYQPPDLLDDSSSDASPLLALLPVCLLELLRDAFDISVACFIKILVFFHLW
jgi:hypothetical protein